MGWGDLRRALGAFGVGETDGESGRAITAVRYRALQRQIPLLYTIILVNYLGFNMLVGVDFARSQHRINLLILFILFRLAHWLRQRKRELAHETMVRELRRTYLFAGLICGLFGFWALRLSIVSDPTQLSYLILFASLAAIGAAYGLSSFPRAARLPLLMIALPLSVRLIVDAQPHTIAMGVSLGLVSVLLLRLISVHNSGLIELVRSRSAVEAERERAQ